MGRDLARAGVERRRAAVCGGQLPDELRGSSRFAIEVIVILIGLQAWEEKRHRLLPSSAKAKRGETDAADFRVDRRNKLIAVLTFDSLSALLCPAQPSWQTGCTRV
jgi:hypothetical protein